MSDIVDMENGRYLLFIDILGFSELVKSNGAKEVYKIIDGALQEFDRWESLNKLFKTIYFSDTFIFYQEPQSYGKWAFLDVYAIGGMVFSALLAKGIPVRGSIAFGGFDVRSDSSSRHQVYFGEALIEAYKAEQRENWIGITILESAWAPYENENRGSIAAFERDGVWKKRHDGVLMLNPFLKLRGWFGEDRIGEIEGPYMEWDDPEFPNDILAFKFLRDQAASYSERGDFSGKVAVKYHATIAFLKEILGVEMYEWGVRISEPGKVGGSCVSKR